MYNRHQELSIRMKKYSPPSYLLKNSLWYILIVYGAGLHNVIFIHSYNVLLVYSPIASIPSFIPGFTRKMHQHPDTLSKVPQSSFRKTDKEQSNQWLAREYLSYIMFHVPNETGRPFYPVMSVTLWWWWWGNQVPLLRNKVRYPVFISLDIFPDHTA